MRARRFAIPSSLLLLGVLAPHSRAFLWWRDKVPGHWARTAPAMDGSDASWSSLEEYDGPGLEIRAMNDSTDLYLFVSSDRRDGRAVLSGTFRQDVTLWFLDRDGKSKSWGILLPFSRLDPPHPEIFTDPRRIDDEPEVASVAPMKIAADSSTVSLPEEIQFQPGLSGKNPSYSVVVPLRLLDAADRKAIAFDFEAARMQPEIRKQIRYAPPHSDQKKPDSNEDDRSVGGGSMSLPGRSGGGRMGRQSRVGSGEPEFIPADSLDLKLSIGLAKQPREKSQK